MHRGETRLVRRFFRNKRLVGGVLLILLLLLFIWMFFGSTTDDRQTLSENDVFYDDIHVHKFTIDQAKPYQRTVEDPVEFIPNRKRTLKTYYGFVQVEDISFVPVNPMKRSQRMLPHLSKKLDYDKPVGLGLGSRSQGGALAPLMPRQISPNASQLYSVFQQLQKIRDERGANKKRGVKGQFLNSEKMLALQAQMKERESQSMRTKDQFQIVAELLKTFTNNTGCKKPMCTDFLTSYDLSHYRYCMKKAKIRYNKEPPNSKCSFINGTKRDAVALVSHPGSGHQWIRQLLQMSAGLCTGGLECDVKLRRSGFPGENLRSGAVLVVNTHQTEPTWIRVKAASDSIPFNNSIDIPMFGSAILLVRDPFNALTNLWRQVTEKNTNTGELWSDFVINQSRQWQQIILSWMTVSHNHPVLVEKFEDLQKETVAELKRMLDFLRTPFSNARVEQLSLNIPEDESSLVYTTDEINYINSMIENTIETLALHRVDSDRCDLSVYLQA